MFLFSMRKIYCFGSFILIAIFFHIYIRPNHFLPFRLRVILYMYFFLNLCELKCQFMPSMKANVILGMPFTNFPFFVCVYKHAYMSKQLVPPFVCFLVLYMCTQLLYLCIMLSHMWHLIDMSYICFLDVFGFHEKNILLW